MNSIIQAVPPRTNCLILRRFFPRSLLGAVVCCAVILWVGLSTEGVLAATPEEEGPPDAYFGLDLAYTSVDLEGQTLNPAIIRGRFGINIFPEWVPKLSLESHFAGSLTDDSATFNGQNATVKLDYLFGVYVRAAYEPMEAFSVYGLLGWASAQLGGHNVGEGRLVDVPDTNSSVSFGAGAASGPLFFGFKAYFEVMQALLGDDFDIFTVNLGLSHDL